MSSTVTASARQYTSASSQYHSITDASMVGLDFNGNVDMYTAGWYKVDTAATRAMIGKWNAGTNNRQYLLQYNAGAYGWFVSHNGSTTNFVYATTFGTPTTNTWHFVETYHDATNDLIGIAVDGGAFDTTAHSTGLFNGNMYFSIGNYSGPVYMQGAVQGVVVTSGIPNSSERAALYNSGSGVLYKDRPTLSTATYISWWDLAETSGVAIDAHGTNHLTDNNTVTSAAGKVTYTAEDASQFTAANTEYLSITDAAQTGLDIGDNDYWFGAWVRLDNTGTLRQVFSKWLVGSSDNSSYTGYISGANVPVFLVTANGGTTIYGSVTGTQPAMVANTWYWVEWWHDSVVNVLGVTYNRMTATTASHTTGIFDGNRDFTISESGSPDYPFNGRIQDVVAVSGIPTSTERDTFFGRGFGVDVSDRPTLSSATYVSWWKLDEASGTRYDSIGSNDLTDNNTVTGAAGVVYDVPAVVSSSTKSLALLGVG